MPLKSASKLFALIRSAERAERAGAPALAAARYAAAAEMNPSDDPDASAAADLQDTLGGQPGTGVLWQNAAQAALTSGDYMPAVEYAYLAADYFRERRHARAAARAQITAAQALRRQGRHAKARKHLTAALEVLRAEPDADTARALEQLAMMEEFGGSPSADRLTQEVLTLGEALEVSNGQLGDLFFIRGTYLYSANRRHEAIAYDRAAAQLATQAGDIRGSAPARLGQVQGGSRRMRPPKFSQPVT